MGLGLVPLPWFIVNHVVCAAGEAEDILGHPPTLQEIFVILDTKNLRALIRDIWTFAGVMSTLLREDIVFVDAIAYRWSIRK